MSNSDRHEPPDYRCPFCAVARGVEEPGCCTTQAEVVLRSEDVVAFVSSHQWPNNPGHVLVIPAAHYENLYTLPDELGGPLQAAVRRVAVALKAVTGCDGTSTRQHNEPAGNQDVWHYHIHVFPRFVGDGLYGATRARVPLDLRLEQAALLRGQLERRQETPCPD